MDLRNNRGKFEEEFKRKIVEEIEAGKRRGSDICLEYGIKGHSTLLKWCRKYGGNQDPMINKERKISSLSLKDDKVLLLQNQVKVLERELKEARLKQATLETLIDIAENHYSISIKKNSGGKQLIK